MKIKDESRLLERLRENSNYALMFVDGIYCLVDTTNNEFIVIEPKEIRMPRNKRRTEK